ncbi:hypothetical protein AAZU54_03590 [Pseudomonas sp. Je.1.5.c]|uniref:hypothetical protein n=1 Tax=Pseudomonas sp. Je.1.5.c TaxID=3142839 RepID=UPI003DA8635D
MNMKKIACKSIVALLATFLLNVFAGNASSKTPTELEVSGALLYGNFVITSFADVVRDGATLEASSNTKSRYFADNNKTAKPEPYEHGFTIKVSPLLGFPKPDTVYARITIDGNTVMRFLVPKSRPAGIGRPQLQGINVVSLEKLVEGKESVIGFDCTYVNINDEKPEARNCRYRLVLTVNKHKT